MMIVVGINVALWFESWFHDLQDAKAEERYLADLRDDLLTDIENLNVVIRNGEAKLQQVAKYVELMPIIADLSLLRHRYHDRDRSNAASESAVPKFLCVYQAGHSYDGGNVQIGAISV
jgi:hypothetical protein